MNHPTTGWTGDEITKCRCAPATDATLLGSACVSISLGLGTMPPFTLATAIGDRQADGGAWGD
ncbi:hypothetical protein ACP4OV_022603 [Aristida adscensionis]